MRAQVAGVCAEETPAGPPENAGDGTALAFGADVYADEAMSPKAAGCGLGGRRANQTANLCIVA